MRVSRSLVEGLNFGRVSLTPWMVRAAAAPEFALPVHSDEPSDGHRHKRLDAGRACAAHLEAEHRLHFLSFRIEHSANLAKQVAFWRCEAERTRADLQPRRTRHNQTLVRKAFFFFQ